MLQEGEKRKLERIDAVSDRIIKNTEYLELIIERIYGKRERDKCFRNRECR
jgi:hypothetical protein